jgi:large subunit ribosomal protein L10e
MLMVHHADRFQDGMRKASGKPTGRAARVEPGQPVIVAYIDEDGVETAKEALKRGGPKLPTWCRMVTRELAE